MATLQRVRELHISTWTSRHGDLAARHVGPTAQDFAAAFGVGHGDRPIHAVDAQGVSLAAIQGLADLVAQLHEDHARLAARLQVLEIIPVPDGSSTPMRGEP
jgi:hypothetical protein